MRDLVTKAGLMSTSELRPLRAMARALLPTRQWRRHGIGLLQGYVREGDDHEVRLHVWHPALIRPGIVDHGDVHDHRFELRSVVLAGGIRHEEFLVEDDPEGEWDVHQVTHARQNPEGAFRERIHSAVPGPLAPTAQHVRVYRVPFDFAEGSRYRFPRGGFHRTSVDGLAVTLVTKTDQIDAGARILARHGSPPVTAFDPRDKGDTDLSATIVRVVVDAMEALQ